MIQETEVEIETNKHRNSFNAQLLKLYEDNKLKKFWKKIDYEQLIELIKGGSESLPKDDSKIVIKYYYDIKKYEVLELNGVSRLVKKKERIKDEIECFSYYEQMFEVIDEVHKEIGHGGLQ